MKIRFYGMLWAMACLMWSCESPTASSGQEGDIYFPIKDFVEVQAEKLQGKSLYKEVNINGQKESSTDTPVLEEWLNEFDFFIQADINKPSLSSAFTTEKSERFLIHQLKEGEKSKVKKIVVEYLEGEIKQVSYQAESKNPFFSSKTRGVFSIHGATGLLDSYVIENIQEVIFSKPNKMIISGHVK